MAARRGPGDLPTVRDGVGPGTSTSSRKAAATLSPPTAAPRSVTSSATRLTSSPSPAGPAGPSPDSPPVSGPAGAPSGSPSSRAASSATPYAPCNWKRSAAPSGTGPSTGASTSADTPVPPRLDAFAADFEARHGLPVERVYVAKMLYGLTVLAAEGVFPPGTTIAAVITGQGASSR